MSDLERVVCAEVDRNEAEPDDARRVHGKADVARLIEVFRNLASLDRVDGADDDQQHVVDERQQEPPILHSAFQYHLHDRDTDRYIHSHLFRTFIDAIKVSKN